MSDEQEDAPLGCIWNMIIFFGVIIFLYAAFPNLGGK